MLTIAHAACEPRRSPPGRAFARALATDGQGNNEYRRRSGGDWPDDHSGGAILVEQNFKMAVEIATRAYVMSKGRIVHEGPAAKLAGDAEMLKQYLGV